MPAAASLRPLAPVAVARPALAGLESPEFNLILACCADLSSGERAERISEIPLHRLDWKRAVSLAQQHGVVPQVFACLSAFAELIPSSALEALRTLYQANARQALWLTGELIRILAHLESCRITALPYKGPALAEILYGDVSRRHFSDLDVLVRREDVSRTTAALRELGYQPRIELTERQQRAYLASGYEYTFDSAQGRNLLEVQWQILPRFYSIHFDVDGFFDRAITVSLGGHSLRTLCAEDLLLALCAHAAKHAWMQLSWFGDITALAQSRSLNWDAVQKEVRRQGIERIIAVTFLLAHKLLGAPTPAPVQACGRKDGAVEHLVDRVLPTLVRGTEYDPESVSYFRLMMDSRERLQDRARFLALLVGTPSVGEWSAIRLPGPLFPLYRVVRVGRLTKRLLASRAGGVR